MSWRERAPGPFSLWARFAPRAWPTSPGLHLDPFSSALSATPSRAAAIDGLPVSPPGEPEVVYLPPVAPERTGERDALAARIAAAGGRPLVHLRAGEEPPGEDAIAVVDLLEALLVARAPDAVAIPAGAWVVVPLGAGLFVDDEHRRRWIERLAGSEAAAASGLPIACEPPELRRLAEVAGEERWEAIFHGATPSEREFARAAASAGLATLPPRPEVALPPRAARNRDLATALALAGELWLRLGRGEAEGEALLAAARRIGSGTLDYAALAREQNLQVVDWLSPLARRLIDERVAGGERELGALLAAWNEAPGGEPAP